MVSIKEEPPNHQTFSTTLRIYQRTEALEQHITQVQLDQARNHLSDSMLLSNTTADFLSPLSINRQYDGFNPFQALLAISSSNSIGETQNYITGIAWVSKT